MKYKIKFEVIDNANQMVVENVTEPILVNPTVADVKTLLNPGTYSNIKSESFVANHKNNLIDSDVVTAPFIYYKINLS
jgi:cell division GTPase FtsZ